MKALIINDSEEKVPDDFLSKWTTEVSKLMIGRKLIEKDQAAKELSLVFLKEVDAKNLHWNYRQKDYATDVLSFETDDPESLGELVLCPTVLKKQAEQHDLSFEHEIGYMVLHGILHLLGFDHEKSEEAAREMFKVQDAIFEELTAPPPKASKKAGAVKASASKAAPAKIAVKAKGVVKGVVKASASGAKAVASAGAKKAASAVKAKAAAKPTAKAKTAAKSAAKPAAKTAAKKKK